MSTYISWITSKKQIRPDEPAIKISSIYMSDQQYLTKEGRLLFMNYEIRIVSLSIISRELLRKLQEMACIIALSCKELSHKPVMAI